MKKLLPIAKWCLIAWGAFSLCAVLIVGGSLWYHTGPGNRDVAGQSDEQDVRFVLNWCNLGDERIEEVVHSFTSARSFTGDHLDAYAIRITHVDPNELTQDQFGAGWFRCDKIDGVLSDAVEFVLGWRSSDDIPWFLTDIELRSSDVYVYPWSIYCHGTTPAAVELIFVRPKDKMVFYMSSKT